MSNLPIIAGTYADLRQVKSRGIWQLVIDVPSGDAEKMVEAFGLPRQDEPTWLAVARLKNPPGARAATNTVVATADAPPPRSHAVVPGGAKKTYSLSQRVGMTCTDRAFWRWLDDQRGTAPGITDEQDAAIWVRRKCGVESRAEIKVGTDAAKAWEHVSLQFEKDTGRLAEERR